MPERTSKSARLLVGLISGTSMDGIDAALVRISGPASKPRVRLLAFETLPYPGWLRERLLAVAGGDETTAEEIDQLHTLLGAAFGEATVRVCRHGKVDPGRLFGVGSHGQTIHHSGGQVVVTQPFINEMVKLLDKLTGTRRRQAAGRPTLPELAQLLSKLSEKAGVAGCAEGGERNIAVNLTYFPEVLKALGRGKPLPTESWSAGRRCTLQIGEPALIAELTGATVVSDFRTADMAAGGQGAPLVPMVDYLLLRDARQGTVALNIGGIANFTVIPAGAGPEEVFGFDTGPGNMIIDGLVRHFTGGKKTYDSGGRWAARGKVIEPLLEEAMRHPFFAQQPPKSAGREQFGHHFIERYFLRLGELADSISPAVGANGVRAGAGANSVRPGPKALRPYGSRRGPRPEDLLRTATELTARTVAGALERFVPGKIKVHRLIISGGGAHNKFLVSRLGKLLPMLSIHRSEKFGLDVDAKEAIAFAVLADRTMHGLPGNLPRVTGARRAVVLGKIARP